MAIETLYNQGVDALENQFAVSLAPIVNLPVTPLSFRVLTVEIPERSVETYEKHWGTQMYTTPAGKISTPNQFSFTFRIDRNFAVYQLFNLWLGQIADPQTGVMIPDNDSAWRTDVSINTIDSSGAPTSQGWTFLGCYPSQMDGVSFNMESGQPLSMSVTMQFIRFASDLDEQFQNATSAFNAFAQ